MIHTAAVSALLLTTSCAMVDVPDARNVQIPAPTVADPRRKAINERPDSVMYLPLGEDILVPEVVEDSDFPHEMVGPFELRGETLAGALQLILADYDISLAFETQEGLTRRITVANLRGDLGKVVHQVCSLANLYCSYEDGTITVKDRQTFTVTLPPLGTGENASAFLDDIASGLGAILGEDAQEPIVDPTTRTLIYSATQRTADVAQRYFQRLRANTAMIVFETYIWEVSLNSGNSAGIDWSLLDTIGKFNTGVTINGTIGADFTNPISIGLPTTQSGTPTDILTFLSQFGAVKTISQPQITVLSGSQAELRVADTQNYVSQIATTLSEGVPTTSVNTDSVDTGFTLSINSSWDKSTVYAGVEIELTDVKQIDDFSFSDEAAVPDDPATPEDESAASGSRTRIQLPQTSERQLSTQIRVRPGDSVLIGGLVRENDNFDEDGPGFMQPVLPQSRTAQTQNLELVILMRPRVVVYTSENDKRYVDYAMKKHKNPNVKEEVSAQTPESAYDNIYNDQPPVKPVSAVQEEIPAGIPAPLTAQPIKSPIGSSEPVPVSKNIEPKPVVAPVAPRPIAPAATSTAPTPTPMPVAKTPIAPVSSSAAPAATSTSSVNDPSRFKRGAGFVSSSMTPVEPVPAAKTVAPASASVPAVQKAPATSAPMAPAKATTPTTTPVNTPKPATNAPAAPTEKLEPVKATAPAKKESIPSTATTGSPASGAPDNSPTSYETYDSEGDYE